MERSNTCPDHEDLKAMFAHVKTVAEDRGIPVTILSWVPANRAGVFFDCKDETISKWIEQGRCPVPVYKPEHRNFLSLEDIARYLLEKKMKSLHPLSP